MAEVKSEVHLSGLRTGSAQFVGFVFGDTVSAIFANE